MQEAFVPSAYSVFVVILTIIQILKALTERGINQAKLANRAIGTYPFWRRYSSDLKRCERTANLILGLEQDSEDDGPSTVPRNDNEGSIHDDSDLILDKRLRERAKDVKEGRPKHLTYDEAFELFRHEHETQTGSNNDHEENAIKVENNVDDNMPLLETEDEVFVRVLDWMQEIVSAAYEDYLNINIGSSGNSSHNKGRYDIFAVTHSGTLRIIIEKIVGEQLPHDVKREETDKDGVQVGKLIVPNTSITTINVYPNDAYIADGVDGQRISLKVKLGSDRNQEVSWKAKLIDLTNTLHLEEKGNENDTNQEL